MSDVNEIRMRLLELAERQVELIFHAVVAPPAAGGTATFDPKSQPVQDLVSGVYQELKVFMAGDAGGFNDTNPADGWIVPVMLDAGSPTPALSGAFLTNLIAQIPGLAKNAALTPQLSALQAALAAVLAVAAPAVQLPPQVLSGS